MLKDKFIIGLIIGVVFPAISVSIFYAIAKYSGTYVSPTLQENVSLLFIAVNGILVRYFMVNQEKDNLGKGLLAVTLTLALAWVLYFHT